MRKLCWRHFKEVYVASVTVQLRASTLSQDALWRKLRKLVSPLGEEGLTTDVKPVFPGERDERLRSAFVVTVSAQGERVAAMLNQQPDVERAYVAPPRRL